MERRDPTLPYFLSVGLIAPHPPLQPPAFYFERYLRTGVPEQVLGDWTTAPDPQAPGDRIAASTVDLQGEALLAARAAYYGSINHVDVQLRRLLNGISGVGRDPNLVVIYLSDHGEGLGDHYLWRKSRAYECTARVPCLITAPQRFGLGHGAVHDQAGSLADIMPTILEMAGLAIPESVDGHSLLPTLRGDGPVDRPHVHIEMSGYHHALTDGRHKYIWTPETGAELLFDLDADPQESHDLATRPAAAELLARWRTALVAALRDRPEGFVRDGQLQATGYRDATIPGSPADRMLAASR